MQRILALGLFVAAMAQLGFAQWTGGLSSYPGGYLLMVYEITVPDAHYTYTLELIPKGEGIYTVRTEVASDTPLEEIADPGLFFVWQPTVWLSEAWWLPYYFAVFGMGGPPQPNRTYVLPGGLSWVTGDMVTIAGVRAVKGILTTPSSPAERVVLAISPDPAVPYPVLIRQERNEGGNWVPTYELVLSRYEHHR